MFANSLTNALKALNVIPSTFVVRTGRIEPQTVRAVMVMMPLGGFATVLDQGNLYAGNQQIIVRSPDPQECYDVAETIEAALKTEGLARSVDGYLIKKMRPKGLPIIYPRNDADLYEASVNFDCTVIRL
jgi:hypothetical protein